MSAKGNSQHEVTQASTPNSVRRLSEWLAYENSNTERLQKRWEQYAPHEDIASLLEQLETAQNVLREIAVPVVLANDLTPQAQVAALRGVVDHHSALASGAAEGLGRTSSARPSATGFVRVSAPEEALAEIAQLCDDNPGELAQRIYGIADHALFGNAATSPTPDDGLTPIETDWAFKKDKKESP
jgi:hypothetical protein